jgi:DNA-binding MarR family transcriptional regulator
LPRQPPAVIQGDSIVMTVHSAVERPLEPRDQRLAPWRAFLLAHARVVRRLDEELRAEHDLTIGEYDALLTIAQAPERRIRMRHLADEVILSKSGVTRLIDRLVDDGLVERSACLSDARGAEAVLTDRGMARLRAASKTHLRGIDEHFLTVLDATELRAIERTMTSIAAHAGPGLMAEPGRCGPDAAEPGGAAGRRGSGGC